MKIVHIHIIRLKVLTPCLNPNNLRAGEFIVYDDTIWGGKRH